MTRLERTSFLKIYVQDMERQKDAIERESRRR